MVISVLTYTQGLRKSSTKINLIKDLLILNLRNSSKSALLDPLLTKQVPKSNKHRMWIK